MTQDTTVPGSPEPGPDNFSFEDYIEGKSTFPVFEHTVYLDQKSGAELGALYENLEELVGQLDQTEKEIKKHRETGANSFVDSALDNLLEQKSGLEGDIAKLEAKRDELRERIVKSGITLVFQVKTPEELGTVTREATRRFHKENAQFKESNEKDLDYITAISRYSVTAQIAHFCTKIQLPDGSEKPPPTQSGADLLLKRLIASENMRLMEAMGTGLGASLAWADKLDAGFPGGSPDVEEVGVGAPAVEDVQVMGYPADHDADGPAERLV
jgi:hypothetical protein